MVGCGWSATNRSFKESPRRVFNEAASALYRKLSLFDITEIPEDVERP